MISSMRSQVNSNGSYNQGQTIKASISSNFIKIIDQLIDKHIDTPEDIRVKKEVGNILSKNQKTYAELKTVGNFFSKY